MWRSPIQRRLLRAGAVIFVGVGVAACIVQAVGFVVAAAGFAWLAIVGFDIAADRNGAAADVAEAFWEAQGIRPRPSGEVRAIGAGLCLIAVIGCVTLLGWIGNPPSG